MPLDVAYKAPQDVADLSDTELLDRTTMNAFSFDPKTDRWVLADITGDNDVRREVAARALLVPHEHLATFSERGLVAFKGTRVYALYMSILTNPEKAGTYGEIGMACRCSAHPVAHPPHTKES